MCLWLRRAVDVALQQAAAQKDPHETGGVLMGYEQDDSTVVTTCIGPGPKAIHTRTSFVPDYDYQEREIARVYKESGRVSTYLGDWHTHPGGRLRLSRIDRDTLRRIAAHPPARMARPVMVILAGGEPWRLGAWRWSPSFLRPNTRVASLRIEICD